MVGGNKTVRFEYYRKGELWYSTECGFMFPVPLSDTGDGTFAKQDKALLFMRYIRQHLEAMAQEENAQQATAAAPENIEAKKRIM